MPKSGYNDVVAFLGCGTLGTAILSGLLTATNSAGPPKTAQFDPSAYIACVRTLDSAQRIRNHLGVHQSRVNIRANENVAAVTDAGCIILGCKPYMVEEILKEEGMPEALQGKVLVSICAGVTIEDLNKFLNYPSKTRLVRAMPNTAAAIGSSMTVIATSTPPLEPRTESFITWIFQQIGDVTHLPATQMDVSTALCGSGPAFFALVLEAAIDGAVAMGLPRIDAQKMAAQTMKGAAGMVLNGEHPALLRDKISTPGGCTIGGLLVLEEAGVRGSVARAIREATAVAGVLGKREKGINGIRK